MSIPLIGKDKEQKKVLLIGMVSDGKGLGVDGDPETCEHPERFIHILGIGLNAMIPVWMKMYKKSNKKALKEQLAVINSIGNQLITTGSYMKALESNIIIPDIKTAPEMEVHGGPGGKA